MDRWNDLTFALSFAAVCICVSDLLFVKVQNNMGKTQNKIFMILLCIVAMNGVCNTLTGYYAPYLEIADIAKPITDRARFIYFVFHTALAPMFFFYISHVCGVVFKSNANYKKYIYYFIFGITEILAITNPFTHWIYFRDKETNAFTRNWGEAIIYVAAAIFLVLAFKYIYTAWGALNRKRRIGMLMFSIITIAGIVIQLLDPHIKVELFAEAIGLTGVMMIIENEDDRIDPETGLYNRQAFIMDLQTYLLNKTKVHAVCLRIETPEIISRNSGQANREMAERKVSEYLVSIHQKYNVYKLGRRTFVLMAFGKNDDEAYDLASRIALRFDKPWKLVDTMVLLSSSLLVAKIPEQLDTLNDSLYMFDSFKPGKGAKNILFGDDLNNILRGSAIEKSISNGLAEGKFEVFFQPTYTIDGRKLHGAEALVRLRDDEMGLLFPDEFIPVAENNGLIDAIDDYVLMEVCKTIKEEKLDEYVDCINVNLSVVQLMKPGFVDHINGIVDMTGVDKSMINFEVTESVSGGSYDVLNNVINDLKKEGFLFSMDDYGTGYSNMKALASMNLDCIKIDKSILWEAEKSELGFIILENCIRMIHQMELNILVEGVETEDQIKLLEPMGVNYLQGYFFSKPVPKDKFLKIVHESDTRSKA